jgi:hypothetical protein
MDIRFGMLVAMLAVRSLVGQSNEPQPVVSADRLTADEIAVYRVVLDNYTKGDKSVLNVAEKTEPLDQSGFGFDKACFKNFQSSAVKGSVAAIHKLDASIVQNSRILLVDPDQQQDTIKANDPQNLVKSVIDEHQEVTDKQLDDSIKRAFETGLFTLSEVLFDVRHRHALVAYSFVCGGLCGNGNLLLLTKVGRNWKVSKTCGGWVS